MSNQLPEAVEAKFEELAEAFNVEVKDLTLTIEDGPMTTSIAGSELDIEDVGEVEDTSEAGDDESEDISEADEDTTEGGDEVDVHFEEMDYNDLQKLASENLAEFPSDSSKAGLVEALQDNIGDVEDISEADDEVTEGDSEEDIIEDDEDEEDSISDAELVEAGVKESNIEDVRKYRSKNGVCSEENCPYGANKGEEFCASHQGSSSSKSKTSKKSSSKKTKNAEDLTEAQLRLVNTLIEDEGKSFEEAVNMV